MSRSCTFVFLVPFLLLSEFSFADSVVYDNGAGGASGIETAFASDPDFSSNGVRQADDVELAATTFVDGIEWTGVYNGSNIAPEFEEFSLAIFADNGGVPLEGPPLAEFAIGNNVERVDSGFNVANFDVFEYSAEISFTFVAQQRYWISIINDTTGSDADFFWGGLTASAGGNGHIGAIDGSSWSQTSSLHDFRLTASPIPEPGTTMLLGLVLFLSIRRER